MTGPMLGGRYVLGELLGRGGMAEVYRAHDQVLGRDVAVKLFRVGDLDASDERRTGEIRLLAGLSHSGLVTVFDAGQDGDTSYLVMELVSGTTLRQRLESGPLSPDETARIGAELSGALAYVHSRGIVHRDVKPANILLAEDGTAKLTDFGVAKLLDGTSITTAGTTLGTPNYLSPEQASGQPLSGASDVYSLGLVLLECLTGAVAFPGHGVEAAVGRLHRPPEIPPGLGPEWTGLLTRMTDRDPAARPDATAVAGSLGTSADAATAPTQFLATPPPPKRRVGWLPAAIAAVVVAIAALGIALAVSAGTTGSSTTSGTPTPAAPTTPSAPETTRTASPATTPVTTPTTTPATTPATTHSVPAPKPPHHKPPHHKPPHKPPHDKPPKHHGKKGHG